MSETNGFALWLLPISGAFNKVHCPSRNCFVTEANFLGLAKSVTLPRGDPRTQRGKGDSQLSNYYLIIKFFKCYNT